jgi:deoxyribose-phosphate aldolase
MAQSLRSTLDIDCSDWHVVSRLIDHTLLKTETTRPQVVQLCEQAIEFGFATVCVHPAHLETAAAALRGTAVKVDAPIGFPQGAHLTSVKRFEAIEALGLGAQELDMVMNVGALRYGDHRFVETDIHAVVEVAHNAGALVKVILETPLLSQEEKVLACNLSVSAGADFVKTATGMSGGATVEDVALLRSSVPDHIGVKASGGIRTAAALSAMVRAGAQRIGTSSSLSIIRELAAPEVHEGSPS